MTDWTLLNAARSYVEERGWYVLPLTWIENGACSCGKATCESPGKHPLAHLVPHGVRDASNNVDQIQAWWFDTPTANIGIATGPLSKISVVDVDPRNGGWESLPALNLPETATAQTGSKGLHYYYRCEQTFRNRTLAKGIDFKSDGGYVVAPPSNHLEGTYQWIIDQPVLTELPDFLARESSGKIEVRDDGSYHVEPDQKEHIAALIRDGVDQGGRHNALISLVGHLANIWPKPPAMEFLDLWNEARCRPPLPTAELIKHIEDGYSRWYSSEVQSVDYWTARTLIDADFPPVRWIVKGLLPEGLAFLGGSPKRGKSWVAIQLAVDIIAGRHTFGTTLPGKVIYLALEDSPRRMKDRIMAMGAPRSDDLIVLHSFPKLDDGGTNKLLDLIGEHQPSLVVIDTLARVLSRKVDPNSSIDITDILGPIQANALRTHTAVLVNDHHRKPSDNPTDMIDDLAGSTAKAAVADVVMGLYRKFNDPNAILKVTGRDIEEKELPLLWNAVKMRWSVEGEVALTTTEKQIIEVIERSSSCRSADIAMEIGVTDRMIRMTMQSLRDRGLVQAKVERGNPGRPSFIYSVPVHANGKVTE